MTTPGIPDFGEIDFTGRRLALHSMPMFHGMGIMQTGWTVSVVLHTTLQSLFDYVRPNICVS